MKREGITEGEVHHYNFDILLIIHSATIPLLCMMMNGWVNMGSFGCNMTDNCRDVSP